MCSSDLDTERTRRRLRPADQATGDPRTEASKNQCAAIARYTVSCSDSSWCVNLVSRCAISTCANADCRQQLSMVRSKQGPTTTGRACRQIRPAAQATGDLRRKRARKREKTSAPPLRATCGAWPPKDF